MAKRKKSVKKPLRIGIARQKRKQNRFDKFFMLSWRKALWIVVAWFAAVILHNVIYGVIKYFNPVFAGDEAFFFIIAIIVIPLYAIASVLYSLGRVIWKSLKK